MDDAFVAVWRRWGINSWMEDFFACHFSFDGQLDVWLADQFCYPDMGGMDENAVVDLSGVSGDHLPMLWTPKNAGK